MTRYTSSRRKKDRAGRHDNGESWATCGVCQKRAYISKKAARAAQRAQRAANDRKGLTTRSADAELRPYRCTTDAWHIGHETPRGANRNDGRLHFLDEIGKVAS